MAEEVDDRVLVEAAQRDPSRFGELYERHFDRVYAFVVRRVRDRDAAEDVTAEVFHRAFANLPKYEWRGAPFGAWLFRIAANAIADRSKRSAREAAAATDPSDASVQLDLDLDHIDQVARLFRFVDTLPADQRSVILHRFVDERSIREVAQRMNKTEGAIKQLQLRALETLRARMGGGDA
jgi:RNA polymerase sigma-70 factor (ECF subfamily)